jgi:hypothetical protein
MQWSNHARQCQKIRRDDPVFKPVCRLESCNMYNKKVKCTPLSASDAQVCCLCKAPTAEQVVRIALGSAKNKANVKNVERTTRQNPCLSMCVVLSSLSTWMPCLVPPVHMWVLLASGLTHYVRSKIKYLGLRD